MSIIGRFAPSPTGHLHLGSLTTAVASFCHVKSIGGQWRVRIEDTDTERCRPEYTTSILYDLENLGLHADGEILHQSERISIYNDYLGDVLAPHIYACDCSRKTLAAHSLPAMRIRTLAPIANTADLHAAPIYPKTCRQKRLTHDGHKLRLCLPDTFSAFYDGIWGVVWDNPARSLGDVVVKRHNGIINYMLACAIDDGLQGISHIMRGLDILPMTTALIHIAGMCTLPCADAYYHLPLLHNADGQKLSKQNLATPIDTRTPQQASALLVTALTLLGQAVDPAMLDAHPEHILRHAIDTWDTDVLKARGSLGVV